MYTLFAVVTVQTQSGPIGVAIAYESDDRDTIIQQAFTLLRKYEDAKLKLDLGVLPLEEADLEYITGVGKEKEFTRTSHRSLDPDDAPEM